MTGAAPVLGARAGEQIDRSLLGNRALTGPQDDRIVAQIGRRLDVLIDAEVPNEKNAWVGRSYADAPDVDGVVYVTGEELSVGALAPCEVVASSNYDLVAVAVGN